MADPSAEHWYPTAAYLYTLHLDGPALAWEYLRRHPDYRRDWLRRRRRPEAAGRWGLPADLMGPVVFLSSSASDYINGYTVAVDGGWLAR